MDNAQKDLRAFLDQWRTDHEQSDTDMLQQLMEAATHYAPQHRFVREAISKAWLWAIVADMPDKAEPLGHEFEKVYDANVSKLYDN